MEDNKKYEHCIDIIKVRERMNYVMGCLKDQNLDRAERFLLIIESKHLRWEYVTYYESIGQWNEENYQKRKKEWDGNKKPLTEANHHKITQSLTYKSDEIGENLSKIEEDQQEKESEGSFLKSSEQIFNKIFQFFNKEKKD